MYNPRDIISHLLPYIATAGAYSAEIQRAIEAHDAKAGDTPFHHALSDADITIQSYLEVVLLARFPRLSYFSEEQEQSLNAKYFAAEAPLEVLLDPIDGTRSYIDRNSQYQIIVTIHNQREIVGAICYMPRRDLCYIAAKGEGAFKLTHTEVVNGKPGAKIDVTNNSGPVLLFHAPELVKMLQRSFDVKDLAKTYETEPGMYDSTDLIAGKASAVVHASCQAIDGGALSFIAAEAGAIMTDFSGNPPKSFRSEPKRTIPEIVVSANAEIHARVLEALRQSQPS
jgi:fructose-1,6-bisphosphatase/inositol monophosphatase family enzyme